MKLKSDSELVSGARNGDLESYGMLVERHEAALANAAYAVMGDYLSAQEIAQDVLVKCYQRLDQLREPEAFGGWARRATVNLARNSLRSRPATVAPEIVANLPLQSDEAEGLKNLEKKETRRVIAEALEDLPEEQRKLVFCRHYEGLSLAEIAEREGVTVSAVSKRLSATHEKMKHLLNGRISAD